MSKKILGESRINMHVKTNVFKILSRSQQNIAAYWCTMKNVKLCKKQQDQMDPKHLKSKQNKMWKSLRW